MGKLDRFTTGRYFSITVSEAAMDLLSTEAVRMDISEEDFVQKHIIMALGLNDGDIESLENFLLHFGVTFTEQGMIKVRRKAVVKEVTVDELFPYPLAKAIGCSAREITVRFGDDILSQKLPWFKR